MVIAGTLTRAAGLNVTLRYPGSVGEDDDLMVLHAMIVLVSNASESEVVGGRERTEVLGGEVIWEHYHLRGQHPDWMADWPSKRKGRP